MDAGRLKVKTSPTYMMFSKINNNALNLAPKRKNFKIKPQLVVRSTPLSTLGVSPLKKMLNKMKP